MRLFDYLSLTALLCSRKMNLVIISMIDGFKQAVNLLKVITSNQSVMLKLGNSDAGLDIFPQLSQRLN